MVTVSFLVILVLYSLNSEQHIKSDLIKLHSLDRAEDCLNLSNFDL